MDANTSAPKTSYYYKLYRVKRKNGKVTTVSMDPALAVRACQVLGGPLLVGKMVREFALAFEESDAHKCCSHYVQKQVRDAMASRLAERNAAAAAVPVSATM